MIEFGLSPYHLLLLFLYPIDITIEVILVFYYLKRTIEQPAIVTTLWLVGWLGIAITEASYYLIFYYITPLFPDLGDIYWGWLLTTGIMWISSLLCLSAVYFELLQKVYDYRKSITLIFVLLIILSIVLSILNAITGIEVYDIPNWISRGFAFFLIGYFAIVMFKDRTFKLSSIIFGFVCATIGGIIIASFKTIPGAIIGYSFQFIFYTLITVGLIYTKKRYSE